MAKEIDIVQYWPQVLRDVKEMLAIAKVENPSLAALWDLIEQKLNDQFISTTSADGATRYEQMLNIHPFDTDTMETRRLRILARIQEQTPYTWIVLNRLLNGLLGGGNYTVARNVATKVLTVRLELSERRQYDILLETLERIVPMNMIIDVSLRYNTHQLLSKFTHEDMEEFTHYELREKEGI